MAYLKLIGQAPGKVSHTSAEINRPKGNLRAETRPENPCPAVAQPQRPLHPVVTPFLPRGAGVDGGRSPLRGLR